MRTQHDQELSTLAASNASTIEQLVQMHSSELSIARAEADQANLLREELNTLKEAHSAAISQIEEDARRRSEELERVYSGRLGDLRQEHERDLNLFRARLENEMVTVKSAHENSTATLKQQLEVSLLLLQLLTKKNVYRKWLKNIELPRKN